MCVFPRANLEHIHLSIYLSIYLYTHTHIPAYARMWVAAPLRALAAHIH